MGGTHHDYVDMGAVVEISPFADFFIGKGIDQGDTPSRHPLGRLNQ